MLFLIYSATDSSSIESSLGLPEYSYYFVLKEFLPLLEKLGQVQLIKFPEVEVDAIYDRCVASGEDCVFLSFSPPNKTLTTLRCPTIPVFAWEFDTLPNEAWDDDQNNDWTHVLATLGQAITHSRHTVATIRRAMGEDFSAISVPAPVWDRFDALRAKYPPVPKSQPVTLRVRGSILDSANLPTVSHESTADMVLFRKSFRYRLGATKRHAIEWYRDALRDLLPGRLANSLSSLMRRLNWKRQQRAQMRIRQASPEAQTQTVTLEGVVYTTVLNPCDGRKNWGDMVTAFCEAFADIPDATLVFKFTHLNSDWAFSLLSDALRRTPPFKCRVIGIHGYLEDDSYEQLIAASTYTVNSSVGEGQCLPLMEFMACGKPAIAPLHTAMLDYIDEQVAFIVRSSEEPSCWPHDPRIIFRAHKHRIDWSSLRDAFQASYQVANKHPDRYMEMANNAISRIFLHASHASAMQNLGRFLGLIEQSESPLPPQLPDLSRLTGLHDAALSGWFNSETGELVPGFVIEPNDVVLDVGCGAGSASMFCAQRDASVHFLDLDADKVAHAAERLSMFSSDKCVGIVSDCTPLPLQDGLASKVIAMEMLEHVRDPAAVLEELVRVGRPGALYLISVPDTKGELLQKKVADPAHFEEPNHIRIFTSLELERLVEEAGLVVEQKQTAGFYWVIWMCFFWVCQKASGQPYNGATLDKIAPPYPPILESWADTWLQFLKLPGSLPIKKELDNLLPKSRIVVARKPMERA